MNYTELDLEELYLQMQDDLYDGLKEEIPEQVKAALQQGQTPQQILDSGLVAGMDIVGVDFRDGILFVPEVLMAANAMKAGMEILRPLLTETGAERVGTAVVGTVKGDIHDIGKNLVAMMLEGAGFEVINLGINVDADKFMAAIKQHKPDIIGMSALLTTTMPYMKVVVDTLGEEGMRDEIYVMVGGAPVTENFAREVGADAYGRDAAVSVEIAKRYMAKKNKEKRAAKAT
ncbi:MAG: corrinoid protein [Caldilineaceae bacterium]